MQRNQLNSGLSIKSLNINNKKILKTILINQKLNKSVIYKINKYITKQILTIKKNNFSTSQ